MKLLRLKVAGLCLAVASLPFLSPAQSGTPHTAGYVSAYEKPINLPTKTSAPPIRC